MPALATVASVPLPRYRVICRTNVIGATDIWSFVGAAHPLGADDGSAAKVRRPRYVNSETNH